jgi:hypothetical protein
MNKTAAKQFRKERADELRSLARILTDEEIVRDDSPIRHAASECQSSEPGGQSSWGYSFEALEFYANAAEDLQHTRPKGAKVTSLELSMNLMGVCLEDDDHADPFSQLAVNIFVRGISNEGETLECAWHLDKHKRVVGKSDGTQ